MKSEAEYKQEILKVAHQGPFTPEWQSLAKFQVPSWFTKAKFGLFIHWGLYSIPAFNNEWYSRNMYIQNSPEYYHHRETYGPQDQFGYQDFIPLFTAEKFDPEEWLDAIQSAGARYFFPVAEHHDGFQLYQSQLSEFNSVNMGPHRDILGELKQSAEKRNIHFCTSSHRAEHWFFFGHGKEFNSDVTEPLKKGDFYWPAMPEPDNQELFSQPYPTQEFLDDWLLRTCEIIDQYQPECLYFDWWIQHEAFKENLKIVSAYYYNRGVAWGIPTAICYKHDAMMFGSGIPEIERGKFANAQPFYWQTDTAIARDSWCYTETLDYKSAKEILQNLIDIVAKNGNMLLNIGPKGDGSLPLKDREILEEIGKWLAKNGEGIYESKVWRCQGEGPTLTYDGQFLEQSRTIYSEKDIRFTSNGDSVYAFFMEPPTTEKAVIRALKITSDQNSPGFHGIIKDVQLLGSSAKIRWRQNKDGLEVTVPNIEEDYPIAYQIKIE
ncbi:alpha-L-fucosidase [Enterococcus canis]|uniref:alpha-L-fucosidase n=1 Tax=Enterococcus canis TaxID=214095 RepID=UPI00082FA200|nr:alpha-L-fucosidase [Enterococcus canis]